MGIDDEFTQSSNRRLVWRCLKQCTGHMLRIRVLKIVMSAGWKERKDVDEDTLNGGYKISPPAALRLLHAFE